MEPLKSRIRNLSLRKSIACYIVIFAVLALLMGNITAGLCSLTSRAISDKYSANAKKYYLTTQDGQRLGEGTYIYEYPPAYSSADENLLKVLEAIPVIAYPLYSALCVIAAAALFYRAKLKQPLSLLTEAAGKISANDLDFTVDYPVNDEMGQLCQSFEIMRSTLSENFSHMWQLMDERKRLNAAFAHDLRTPLTVLKGYTEIFQLNGDPSEKETADIMSRHIERMEHYMDSMSHIRKLEDIAPVYARVELQPWLESQKNTAALFCKKNNRELNFEQHISSEAMNLDVNLIQQVLDNLLANAVRYAKNRIQISIQERDRGLRLSVTDDGSGFSPSGLKQAAEPYYRDTASPSNALDSQNHLGLGLYICKILCQHHGGSLSIENTASGAKVTAFFQEKVYKK